MLGWRMPGRLQSKTEIWLNLHAGSHIHRRHVRTHSGTSLRTQAAGTQPRTTHAATQPRTHSTHAHARKHIRRHAPMHALGHPHARGCPHNHACAHKNPCAWAPKSTVAQKRLIAENHLEEQTLISRLQAIVSGAVKRRWGEVSPASRV